jgi:hypothetical protein
MHNTDGLFAEGQLLLIGPVVACAGSAGVSPAGATASRAGAYAVNH